MASSVTEKKIARETGSCRICGLNRKRYQAAISSHDALVEALEDMIACDNNGDICRGCPIMLKCTEKGAPTDKAQTLLKAVKEGE
jgi:hypothetical protein